MVPLAVFVALHGSVQPLMAFPQSCPVEMDLGTLGAGAVMVWGVSGDGQVVVGEADVASPVGATHAFRWDVDGGMQDLQSGAFAALEGIAWDVSEDGATIVGEVGDEAFLWTAASGLQVLGSLGQGFLSHRASFVSADGAIVVGTAFGVGGRRIFLWSAATGMRDIGLPGGWHVADAFGLSADGSTVIGRFSATVPPGTGAFRWTVAGGFQDLGSLSGDITEPSAVSRDGTVVVGQSAMPPLGRPHAFRWTNAGGMQDLTPGVQQPLSSSQARAVSSDGSTVCGYDSGAAFRWTVAGGLQDLGTLGVPSSTSSAQAMSADGAVIFGVDTTPTSRVFRWTAVDGMTELGIEPTFLGVRGVSLDGTVVVGDVIVGGATRAARVEVSLIGVNRCRPADLNATGCSGFLRASGSASVAVNALRIDATSLPRYAFGYVLVADAYQPPMPASVGRGRTCLGGAIGRLVGPGQIGDAGASGSFSVAVDLSALPTPTGPVAGAPGDSWTFQAWHRDSDPAATTNWTDSVTVTLQ